VANLIGRKGIDVMLEGFAKAALEGVDFRVVGNGSELPGLKAQAEKLGIAERVIFEGSKFGDEKLSLIRGAKLFLSASRKEPYSNSLLEAMAAGIPVVASAVDGSLEMVKPGINGWLFPSENSAALAECLVSGLADENERLKVVETTRTYIQRHDWPVIAAEYIELYSKHLPSAT